MPFEVGQTVGDYEISGVLGKGGMGCVYRVRNVISNRVEAIKVLLEDVSSQAELGDRFIAEIRTLARLDHPHIAKFHTAFKIENQLVMVMEFVEGATLVQCAAAGPLPLDRVLGYMSQTLSALGYAHENGVIHRDVKPSNVMVTSNGVVKLMDFGIAKSAIDPFVTRPGTTVGSMLYMSPEQVRGNPVNERSDLYSVGVMLYELTAGRRPFDSEATFEILEAHLNQAPKPPMEVNPKLPPALNEIILTALKKDPAQRFASAAAFRRALDTVSQQLGATQTTIAQGRMVAPGRAASGAATAAMPGPIAASAAPPSSAARPSAGPASAASAPPAQRKGNRGLWMAIGALVCVAVLVGAAMTLPHFFKGSAASSAKPASAAQTGTAPVQELAHPANSQAASSQAIAQPADSQPVPAPSAVPAVQPDLHASVRAAAPLPKRQVTDAPQASAPVNTAAPPPPPVQAATPEPPPGPSQEEIDQASEDLMKLRSRATAVRSGLDSLRSQQAASGLGLRTDMVAAESRMNEYLQAADQALRTNRLDFARKNMDRADEEITKLEKFLGR